MTLRFSLVSLVILTLLPACGSKGGEAPSAPVVAVGPSDATTTDDLVVSIVTESTDPDGADVTYVYKWLVNDVLRDDLSESTVPAAETAKGETWTVLVTASDGDLDSSAADSSVTILNTPPTVSLALENTAPRSTDDIVAVATVEDLDGDVIGLTWSWTVDGADTNEDDDTVPAASTAKGEEWEVSLVVSDGEADVSPESIEVVVLNAPPTVTAISIEPTEAYETSVLIASATTEDADGDVVTVAWAWSVNGTVITDETSNILDGGSFSKHDSVLATATPSDDEEAGAALDSDSLAILNSAPAITSLSLDPTDIYEATTVTCTPAGWTDVDADTEAYLYAWEINATTTAETGSTVDGTSFSKGDTVMCTATPDDGDGQQGDTLTSATAIVGNSPPAIASATLSSTLPQEGDTITVIISGATDDDGDIVSFQYAWYVDSAFVAATSELTSSSFNKGQSIWVDVTPFDGTDTGTALTSDTAMAQNTSPVLDSVTLTPNPVAYSGSLSCLPGTVTDADADIITYAYTWSVDGMPITATTENLDNTWFLAGSSVLCSITPHDGEDTGAAVPSNTITVNHPPSVGNVVISPATPTAADAITCQHATPLDADGDSVSVAFEWTIGPMVAASTSSTLGATVRRGDVVACTVTPSDPYESGIPGTDSATVVNTPPEVTSVTLSPSDPTTDSIVTANAVASDLDGDTVSLNYAFSVAGSLKQASSSNELDGTAHFKRGESISVAVTPQDAQNQGPVFSGAAAVTVVNSPPTAPGISITPTEPIAGLDTLTCTVDTPSTDSDTTDSGDTITYSFNWFADTIPWTGSVGYQGLSSNITVGDANSADAWKCIVTPTDSFGEDGPTAEVSVVLECAEDLDCDTVLTADDCDDADSSTGAWDNSLESASLTSSAKAWTYEYENAPNFGGDSTYDGFNGVLNDGVESWYGDPVEHAYGSYLSFWSWWQNSDPSIIIHLPYTSLEVTSVGAYVSHGVGGGIAAPSSMTVYHRPNSSSAWTSIGSSSVAAAIGWASVNVVMPGTGGDLKLDLAHSAEHTIISELSIQGDCLP